MGESLSSLLPKLGSCGWRCGGVDMRVDFLDAAMAVLPKLLYGLVGGAPGSKPTLVLSDTVRKVFVFCCTW